MVLWMVLVYRRDMPCTFMRLAMVYVSASTGMRTTVGAPSVIPITGAVLVINCSLIWGWLIYNIYWCYPVWDRSWKHLFFKSCPNKGISLFSDLIFYIQENTFCFFKNKTKNWPISVYFHWVLALVSTNHLQTCISGLSSQLFPQVSKITTHKKIAAATVPRLFIFAEETTTSHSVKD